SPANIGTASSDGDSSVTSLTSPATSVLVGDTIFVAVAMDPTSSTVTVTDAGGNSYTKDADVSNSGGVRSLLFSAPVTAAFSGGTIVVHFTASVPANKLASFFSIEDLLSPATDKSHTATGADPANSPDSGLTAATSQPDELLIGVIGYNNRQTSITPGAGYIALGSIANGGQASGNGLVLQPEYETVAAVGTYAATGTQPNSNKDDDWATLIVTYKKKSPFVVVDGISRASANPTCANSVNFTVTFSEAVFNVDVSDFTLVTSGLSGASVSSVSGSGAIRTVTVNTGTGSGTLGLNLVDNDTIVD